MYFSAPKYLLKKLQSIDSKAIRIALGVVTVQIVARSNLDSLYQVQIVAIIVKNETLLIYGL